VHGRGMNIQGIGATNGIDQP